jgi:hypothetical protein
MLAAAIKPASAATVERRATDTLNFRFYREGVDTCTRCPEGVAETTVSIMLAAVAVVGLAASGWAAGTATITTVAIQSKGGREGGGREGGGGGGGTARTDGNYPRRYVVAIAVGTVVLHTLQVVSLVSSNVPWPSTLSAVLQKIGYLTFQLDATRPECLVSVGILGKSTLVLYVLPGLLTAGYASLLCVRGLGRYNVRARVRSWQKACKGRHSEPAATTATAAASSLLRDASASCIGLSANVYWVWIALLTWSWQWLACSKSCNGGSSYWLNAQTDVACFDFEAGGTWQSLASVGAPALFVYQLALPIWLVRVASTRPQLVRFVTEQYRRGWKWRWLGVDLCYKTLLVLAKVFLSRYVKYR